MAKRRKRRVSFRGALAGVSKHDFVAIAKAACEYSVPDGFVRTLASYFSSQNPRFDSARFVRATKSC